MPVLPPPGELRPRGGVRTPIRIPLLPEPRTGVAGPRLIVNADDYGYFDAVSQGILRCAEAGLVTATGIMANGPDFDRHARALLAVPSLSVGVHLNVTLGEPLTSRMRAELPEGEMGFSRKGRTVARLLRRRIRVATVLHEWRAQIERCRSAGLRLHFLNSHEHIHMVPALFGGVQGLGREFGIRHVRAPRPEWGPSWTPAGSLRNAVFAAARRMLPAPPPGTPVLIGTNRSGRIDLRYLGWRLARLGPGTFELMCHPGLRDPAAAADPQLARYHDWELELHTLMSPEWLEMLRERGAALVSYADLPTGAEHHR